MKVILKNHVDNLGRMGDVVDVSNGYGRNYLLPQGLAVPATTRNVARLDHEPGAVTAKAAKEAEAARDLGTRLGHVTLAVTKSVGDTGRLYGSVTSMEIEDLLHDAGFTDVERRQIQLDQPLKEVGEFEVPIRVHPDVTVPIKVRVLPRQEGA